MIKTLSSKVSGNVYGGDHVDHVEVEEEQNLLDHPNDQDRTHEEVVEVRSEDQELGGNTTTAGGGRGA